MSDSVHDLPPPAEEARLWSLISLVCSQEHDLRPASLSYTLLTRRAGSPFGHVKLQEVVYVRHSVDRQHPFVTVEIDTLTSARPCMPCV